MKKLFSTLVLSFAVLLSACSPSSDNDADRTEAEAEAPTPPITSDIIEEEHDPFPLLKINFPTLEEVQREYPDKTVLVWVIEETGYERNYPFRTREVNEYLDSKGYGLAVCFYPISSAYADEDKNDFYTDRVKLMVERGERADIIYSSYTYIEEGGSNAYFKDVYNGLFEPLDSFFDTEIGKKL